MHLPMKNRNRTKVHIAMSVAVFFGAFGDISLSRGMKDVAASPHSSIYAAAADVVTNTHVLAGIALLLGFLILYLISLSWEDLSFVLPLTGGIYVLVTIFAFFLLHEPVSILRCIGSILVACGIAVVARS
jgi:drug/metabolite transporter (DMT)-like permease